MIKIKQEPKEWDIDNLDTIIKDSDEAAAYIKIEEVNKKNCLVKDESNEDEDKSYHNQLLVSKVAIEEHDTTDDFIVNDIKFDASSIDNSEYKKVIYVSSETSLARRVKILKLIVRDKS